MLLMLLVHLITDVILLLMLMMQLCTKYQMNPQNFQTSCLKNCEWYSMLNYSREIETLKLRVQ